MTFGKLELAVMDAFGSKYALALYEHASRRVSLRKPCEEYTVDEFREILGVADGQIKAFGNFKQRALVPALEEVNYWASFNLTLAYKKTGQRVTSIVLGWMFKDRNGRARVRAELEKSKIGRKARMKGIKETVVVLQPDTLADIESIADDGHKLP